MSDLGSVQGFLPNGLPGTSVGMETGVQMGAVPPGPGVLSLIPLSTLHGSQAQPHPAWQPSTELKTEIL